MLPSGLPGRRAAAPREPRRLTRRAGFRAGLAALGTGLIVTGARAGGLPPIPCKTLPTTSGGLICPLYPYPVNPVNGIYYYYAFQVDNSSGSCVIMGGPYCMTSAQQLDCGCSSGGNDCEAGSFAYLGGSYAGTASPFPETSYTKQHIFGKKKGGTMSHPYPNEIPLTTALPGATSLTATAGQLAVLDQGDYLVDLDDRPTTPDRTIAVRVFLLLVTPPASAAFPYTAPPMVVGIGQELPDKSTATDKLPSDKKEAGKYYLRLYRQNDPRWPNNFFHVLTKTRI